MFAQVSHLPWMPLHAQSNDADQQSLLMHGLVDRWCYVLHDEFAAPGKGKMREAAGVHTHATWRMSGGSLGTFKVFLKDNGG